MTTRNANIEAAADQWHTAMTTAADALILIATMLREVQAGRITKTAACESSPASHAPPSTTGSAPTDNARRRPRHPITGGGGDRLKSGAGDAGDRGRPGPAL